MNDDDATALLDRLTADLPDPAAPVGLLPEGRRRARRRRRVRLGVGLAAVVLAVAGVAIVPTLVESGDAPTPADQPFPDPPPGMKWVGQGRVVVAVPADWRVDDGLCSGGETAASVGVASTARCAPGVAPSVTRVEFGSDELLGSESGRCELTQPPTCSATVDEDGIRVRVTATGTDADTLIDRILDSQRLLPDGWTTVPFAPNSRLPERIQVLEDAGLDVVVEDAEQIRGGYVTVSPGLGSPIEQGGTVTLSPGRPPEQESMLASPSLAEPGQVIDLLFPSEATRGIAFTIEAEDGTTNYLGSVTQGGAKPMWSTDPLTVVDIGVGGPGPDRVVVPDVAAPGRYRICTANAAEQMCTGITVTD